MNKFLNLIILSCLLITCKLPSFSQNPIIQTIYTADPAPLVYNDTLFLYTGHDEDASTYFTMKDWRLFSTTDMVNWTHHGSPLSISNFAWAKQDAWAGQCIYRNGKFYWYVPVISMNAGQSIGIAVSDRPTGPFKDALGKPLLTYSQIDPTVFVDDDGQAYLYYGNPDLYYVKLNEDMISYSGAPVKVNLTTEGFGVRKNDTKKPTSYEEAPWLSKRNGIYYLSYAGGPLPEHIAYSTGVSPIGPWTYGNIIMPAQGGSFTNHQGIVDYKGNSYFFYHNGALPGGGGFTRSVCVEKFTYNANGSIPTFNMTSVGVSAVSNLNPYNRNEAETMAWELGIETENCSQGGINVYAIETGDYIKVRNVDFGSAGAGAFSACVSSSTNGGTIELRLNSPGGTLIGSLPVKYTGGWDVWKTETTNITGAAGVNDLFFVFKGAAKTSLFKFDYWKFEPKTQTKEMLAINATVGNYKIDTITGSNSTNFKIIAIYSDGTSEDITSQAEVVSSPDGIVTISKGTIKGITYGPVDLIFNYNGKSETLKMLVKDLNAGTSAKSLSLSKNAIDLLNGTSISVVATVTYNDGATEDVTPKASYKTSGSAYATISNGKITGKAKGTANITVSFKGLTGDTVKSLLTVNVFNGNPYVKNEAESFAEQSGIQTGNTSDIGGGLYVGWIENGDWIKFSSLDFGTGAASFEARVSSATSGGNIEIRLGSPTGTLLGTCPVSGTGGWENWQTKTCTVSGATGVQTVYLVFTGTGFLMNINWWKFNANTTNIQKRDEKKPVSIIKMNNTQYLKGLKLDDSVKVFDDMGRILSSIKATSDTEEIRGKAGMVIIHVKSENQFFTLKTVLF